VNAAPVSARIQLSAMLQAANCRDACAEAFRNLRPREHAVDDIIELATKPPSACASVRHYGISALRLDPAAN
jgi:hypothetical protein